MEEIYVDGATVGQNEKLGTMRNVGLGVYFKNINLKLYETEAGISNNEAEFKALIFGLKTALKKGIYKATFYSDSQIVVNRANGKRPYGKYQNTRMDDFQNTVLDLADKFELIEFIWISREQNMIADSLSKRAVAEILYG